MHILNRKFWEDYQNIPKVYVILAFHQNTHQPVTIIEFKKNVDYLSQDFTIIIKSKMENYSELNMKTIETKCRSKKEMYDILTIQGGFYLPPISQTSSDFIYDVMIGNK